MRVLSYVRVAGRAGTRACSAVTGPIAVGGLMKALIGSTFAQVAELGVFFAAAAALTAGALALR